MDALATFVSFQSQEGVPVGLDIQNFYAEQVRTYEGRQFMWAGFGYTGAAVSLAAANVEATLVFMVTDLMLSYAQLAHQQRWLARVWTVWLDPDTLDETSDQLEEVYSVSSWTQDLSNLAMTLSSPLDAQDAEIPARVLTRTMVGDLPPSGSVLFI